MQRSQTKNTIKIVNCIWISSIKHFLPFLCNKDKVIKNKPKNTPSGEVRLPKRKKMQIAFELSV